MALLTDRVLDINWHTLFFNKNKLNKNTEAEIAQKNKNRLRTECVAELPCFGLKVSAMLVHQRSDTRTVYFHALYFVLNLDNHN